MNKFIASLILSVGAICSTFADNRESANIDGKDFINESALHDAVRSKSLDMVKFLVEKNANINSTDEFGYTPLHLAVRYQDQNITNFLIENNATIDTEDTYGDTPLLDALRNDNTPIAKKLICQKASRDVVDDHDMSALHYATKNNNIYLAKLLTVDYVELYCQDKIEISIDKDKILKDDTSPTICGKIDIGYVSDMNMTLIDDKQTQYGPYEVKFDNKKHTWCSKVKDKLPKSKYEVSVNAKDYVVNEAQAKADIFIFSDIVIDINAYEEPIDSLTPNICGTIQNAYASKVELSVSSDSNESLVLGTYYAQIDNKNRTWCANVVDKLQEGIYNIKAIGVDDANNSSVAKTKITLKSGNKIDIAPVAVYNDNTPEICGKIIKGDITSIELSLKSDIGKETQSFEGKVDSEENSWCVDVTQELENGHYTITATGYDDSGKKAIATQDTKIYLIMGLYEALNEEFSDDFSKWNAELDKDTLTFRFKDPTLLFNTGRSAINEKFEAILSDFFPRYVNIVNEYKDEIELVRVEGHSSSEHSRARNDEERFELNRQLSQERAQAVMNYAKTLDNEIVLNNSEWISSVFTPIGMSYSKLIYNLDGSENKELSRRVEFRVVTKNVENIEAPKEIKEDIQEVPEQTPITPEEPVIEEEPIKEDEISLEEQLLQLEN